MLRNGEGSSVHPIPPTIRNGYTKIEHSTQHYAQTDPAYAIQQYCAACNSVHLRGNCVVKDRLVEHCSRCGLAHFAISWNCPHLGHEVQIRHILDTLCRTKEPKTELQAVINRLRQELFLRAQSKKQSFRPS
jgi:hypothetical protein